MNDENLSAQTGGEWSPPCITETLFTRLYSDSAFCLNDRAGEDTGRSSGNALGMHTIVVSAVAFLEGQSVTLSFQYFSPSCILLANTFMTDE